VKAVDVITNDIDGLTIKELNAANMKYHLFHTSHEGYAVIKEEIEETMDVMNELLETFAVAWDKIKNNQPAFNEIRMVKKLSKKVAIEAVQTSAMCEKFNMSLATGHNSNQCVICGAIIPEGSHVCNGCRSRK
jgi:3-oxoacyl-[acyl-carrier-protein] synthase III